MFRSLFALSLGLGLFLTSTVHAIDRGGVDLEKAQRIRGRNVQRSVGNVRQSRRTKLSSYDLQKLRQRLNAERAARKEASDQSQKKYDPSAESSEKTLHINRKSLSPNRVQRKRPNFSIRSKIQRPKNEAPSTRGRNRRMRPGSADRTYRRKMKNNENLVQRRSTRRLPMGSSYKKALRKALLEEMRERKE